MKHECPRCGSTRIVNGFCTNCKESLTGLTNKKVLISLAVALLFTVAIAAVQNDVLMFF